MIPRPKLRQRRFWVPSRHQLRLSTPVFFKKSFFTSHNKVQFNLFRDKATITKPGTAQIATRRHQENPNYKGITKKAHGHTRASLKIKLKNMLRPTALKQSNPYVWKPTIWAIFTTVFPLCMTNLPKYNFNYILPCLLSTYWTEFPELR